MNDNYVPRADSVAARCIAFFKANPHEELTLEDITDKFDAGRSNIHTLLAPAREAGYLGRYQNIDGEYIYRAGSKIGKADGIEMDAVHGRSAVSSGPFGAPKRRTASAPVVALPDPLTVPIDDDIPLPSQRNKRDWSPLLKRLKVKQSAGLPIAARHTLSQAITQAKKDKLGDFTLRVDHESQTVRVWRTA